MSLHLDETGQIEHIWSKPISDSCYERYSHIPSKSVPVLQHPKWKKSINRKKVSVVNVVVMKLWGLFAASEIVKDDREDVAEEGLILCTTSLPEALVVTLEEVLGFASTKEGADASKGISDWLIVFLCSIVNS